jgi:hypothetical protein
VISLHERRERCHVTQFYDALGRTFIGIGAVLMLIAVWFPMLAGVGFAWWPASLYGLGMGGAIAWFGHGLRRRGWDA